MKKNILTLFILLSSFSLVNAQKTISEGTISYKIQIKNSATQTIADSATSTIYLKGGSVRTDMINSLGSETTIYDSKAGNATILKQYSGQKLMITLTKDNWDKKYAHYNGIVFKPTDEVKTIAGYKCKKAIAQLSDGTSFNVYYSSDWNVFNKDYDPIFKNLNGLPIQYEFERGPLIFSYILASLDQSPIPSAKFEIPKSGYRVMTYDESQQKKN